MSNPVVLITGGLTGIGRAAAVAFAKKGAKVVVAGRRDDAGKGARVGELRSSVRRPSSSTLTSARSDDVRATVVIRPSHGFARLDVAVNNAATEGQVGPITGQTGGKLCRQRSRPTFSAWS